MLKGIALISEALLEATSHAQQRETRNASNAATLFDI
jgi:hypothetical protein